MPMKMDERQALAVQKTGTDILVSASAGAGKTRVLVERLVKRCIEDHVSMDEILAVTFTEAAASEMKNRIAARLQELSETEGSDQEWIRRQMVLLADADITTIDSFCLNLIRKYFSVIGLDPATAGNILEESAGNLMLEAAFISSLREYNQTHHEQLVAILEAYCPRTEDYSGLKNMVLELKKKAEQYGDPISWLKNAGRSLDEIHSLSDLPAEVRDAFFGRLDLYYEAIRDRLQQMADAVNDNPQEFKHPEQVFAAGNLFLSCEEALKSRNYDLFREMFLMFGADQKTPSCKAVPAYEKARDAMYKACDSLTEILYDSSVYLNDIREIRPYCETLSELAVMTMEHFQKAKRDNACMDFTDMELYAYEILTRNDMEVAKLFRARLKEVMVDEFQDTSYLQNSIIETLAAPGTIFRVGDVKQSIYRFRGARPALMRNLSADSDVFPITLDHNYRSLHTVIEFSNVLFQRLMNIDGTEDHYGAQDTVSPGTDRQKDPNAEPIRLILLQEPPKEERTAKDLDGKERKAGWIASRMIELHRNGAAWNEFAVLVRSHADKITLARIFERCGIPYDIDTREGFYNSDLCRYILAVCSYINNPADELSLLTVLSGELVQMENEEIARLRLNYGSVRKGVEEAHPELTLWFDGLRNSVHNGVPFLLDEIARHNGYYEALSETDKANFDFLYEKTCALSGSRFTLADLLSMMRSGTDEKSSNASSRSKDDDVITVTTIHQSKGLQYKTVFLWGTGMNMLMDSKSELICDNDVIFGLCHYDMPWRIRRPTILRIAAEYRQNIADIEEFIRVLYVALTRSEERMYIVDLEKNAQAYCPDLTLHELDRRKGITGYMTAALRSIPGLYEVITVPPQDLDAIERLTPHYADTLVHYDHDPLPPLSLLRPSEHETFTLPPLSPGCSGKGTQHGILIHRMIKDLPNRVWTEADLSLPSLHRSDQVALLEFCHSHLYQKALGMEIRKELPFYAEDPDTSEAIMGVIDFAAFSEHEVILIDFKTDALSISALRNAYTPQLNMYRRAMHLLKPDAVIHAYLYSFHNHTEIEIL